MNKKEIINRALKINGGHSTRAEKLKDYSKFFVDPIHSSILEQNTNQLIFGRRGSGKTLLMGALNEKIQRDMKETKVMSFYYTATHFRNSAEYGGFRPTVKEKAHAFFHAFVEQLSHDVFSFADVIFEKPSLLSFFNLSGSEDFKKRDRLITCVFELLEATSFGTECALPSSVTVSEEKNFSEVDKNSAGAKIGVKGNLSIDKLALGISSYLKREKLTTLESSTIKKILYATNRCFNPKRIRDLLIEIIDILGLKYIVIFIDEWMSLDECQVEFAERLRRCLFGESKIAVKIAADPYQSSFNNGGQRHNFRGLEVDADIFEAINLDLPFRDPTRHFDLFSEALYKRLCYFEPNMVKCFGELLEFNPEYFVTSIFANKRAFLELCNGAQGICRDFHLVFQDCTKKQGWDISNQKIDFNSVRKSILDKTFNTYGRVAESIDSNKLLFNVIRPHIMISGSRYFIVESKLSQYSNGMKDLLSKRIIHSSPKEQIHSTLRGEYNCFELDYGIYLDLMRAMEYSTGEQKADSYDPGEVSRITTSNISKYLLNINSFEEKEEKTILCIHCSKEFSSYEPSYKSRRLCSICFMEN